jgi:arylsulfatase A-like enzyme
VLFLTDTLRADYLGGYGFQGDVSPAIDRLAAESLRFRRAFTNAPWTKPSVASMFTSLYPQVHGLNNHSGNYWGRSSRERREGILPEAAATLAEALRERGYRTAAFVSNPLVASRYGFQQGFEVYHDRESHVGTKLDALVDDAMAWLGGLGPDEPFFLYIHTMDVHGPYSGTREDYEVLRASPSLGADRVLAPNEMPEQTQVPLEQRPAWAQPGMRRHVAYWRTRYASGVRAFDRRFADLLGQLAQSGRLDRSWFLFTSDHGEELHDHGGWSHGKSLFEHQVRIPLLVRRPGGKGARDVDTIVEHVDLMPTLLALAGATAPGTVQGRDLSGVMRGGRGDRSAVAFGTSTMGAPGLYSVRSTTHKLLFDAFSGKAQLFDLRQDPAERRDVSAEQPQIARELRDRLTAHLRESVAGGTLEARTIALPAEDRARLEALGYLH